jgi:hypothetical protein
MMICQGNPNVMPLTAIYSNSIDYSRYLKIIYDKCPQMDRDCPKMDNFT